MLIQIYAEAYGWEWLSILFVWLTSHCTRKQHADYTAFCEKTLSEKDRAIEEGTERIERLKADIEKFEASVTTLTSELQAHQKEIEVAQQDSEKNTALRQQEESDYSSTHQEYQESIRVAAGLEGWGFWKHPEAPVTAQLVPQNSRGLVRNPRLPAYNDSGPDFAFGQVVSG